MNIVNQLEQTVTPAVLGASHNVAQNSLLEQFYALLVTRLAMPEVYQQLQRDEQNILESTSVRSILFEQVWQQPSQRHLLIQELATTHHIPVITTEPLLINATLLAYQELKTLANGQFLPAFLQLHQADIRQYLPVWAAAVISPVVAVVAEEAALATDALIYDNSQIPTAAAHTGALLDTDAVPVIIESHTQEAATAYIIDSTDAIHANPSDYRSPDSNSTSDRAEIRQRNQRNDLITRLLLLAAALGAILLLWFFVFKSEEEAPVEPVVIAPVETTPEIAPPVQPLTPAQLIVGVDYGGNLYACSATVGDINLEALLRKALNSSFGDQTAICQVTVQEGVATTLSNIDIETLPNVLTLMRTTPFSRLQLQNDIMNIEAPDDPQLQRLLVDVRTLWPAMNITSAVPVMNTQPPANTYDDTYNNNGAYNPNNNGNGAMQNNGNAPITSDNNTITNQSNDSISPPPQSTQNNGMNSMPQNNQPTQSSNQMPSDVTELANTTIVSETASGTLSAE